MRINEKMSGFAVIIVITLISGCCSVSRLPDGWLLCAMHDSESLRESVDWQSVSKREMRHLLGTPSEVLDEEQAAALVPETYSMGYFENDEQADETWKYSTKKGFLFLGYRDDKLISIGVGEELRNKVSAPGITNLPQQITNPFKDFQLKDVGSVVFYRGERPIYVLRDRNEIENLYSLVSSLKPDDTAVSFIGWLVTVSFYGKEKKQDLASYGVYNDLSVISVSEPHDYADKRFPAKSKELAMKTFQIMQKYCPEEVKGFVPLDEDARKK